MSNPIISFGQQPCGFFPKRFLYAKIQSAKKLQSKIGGKIVFFYHDSDADYRETITVMRDIRSGAEVRLNFLQPNKIQKKFSPLYAKRIASGWKQETLKQLPRFMAADAPLIKVFASVEKDTVADFCLEMYRRMGLLERIEVMRSGERDFRERAADIDEYYADVEYTPPHQSHTGAERQERKVCNWCGDKGEIVRALWQKDHFVLHSGGGKVITLPVQPVERYQKSPGRDLRFGWMQSVIHCTHYIMGESEAKYLDRNAFPEVTFIERDPISEPAYAWLDS